ncbi:hypothetical protein KVV02_001326 [Mortierella alpina]|uniref:DNA helicase n=1 Tax=Mortierella alpina TaxID=64518 RepID=A0A9P8CXI6_MORAP|nr:hypothetical protein KVV02_001326 [Mortierella alpina]
MSALQRLQEFRFKKMQEASTSGNQGRVQTAAKPTVSPQGTPNYSNSSSSSNSNSIASNKPEPLVLESDSDSDLELRAGVNKLTTNSPLRGSPRPSTPSLVERSTSATAASRPSESKHQKSASSSSNNKLPFKKLVRTFSYTGDDAIPLASDSDQSLSSPEESSQSGSDDLDVVMMDKHSSPDKSARPKRQIISSDEEQDHAEAPPRRQVPVPEVPKRRRLVKKAALRLSDDEEDEASSNNNNTRSGSTTHQVSDDDLDNGDDLDMKLAQLQTTFPDTPFDELKRALDRSRGDFAAAASRLLSVGPSSILDLSNEHSHRPLASKQRTNSAEDRPTRLHKLFAGESTASAPRSRLHKLPPERFASTPPSLAGSPASTTHVISDDSDDAGDYDRGSRYSIQSRKEERAVQFFNEATLLELRELTGCSKAQASGVIGLRPFDNFDQLCVILRKTKGVGEKIVNNYLTTTDAIRAVDTMLKTVDQVRVDLVGTLSVWCGDEHGKLFENSTSSNSMQVKDTTANDAGKSDLDEDDVEEPGMELLDINTDKVEQTEAGRRAMKGFIRKQPRNMAPGFQLKGYQLLGINWLALLWRKKLSGILADEMGLGKTAQVIAFLAHLLETGEQGPFLVIVPSSTLSNWMREFEKFCPELDVRSYYGTQAEREEMRQELEEDPSYNVVVTTYNIATGNNDERKFLNRRQFKGVVLDEGHMLKNCTSARYKQLMSIKTPFRLLLTGTPLQNNLEELLSLLIFILPKLFAEHEEVLRTMFKVKVDATSEKSTLLSHERIVRARHMIAPFVLRRKKIHVLKDLPKKTEQVIYCDLHPDQRVLYDRVMQSSAVQAVLDEEGDLDADGATTDPIELDSLDSKAKAKVVKKGTSPKSKKLAAKTKSDFANVLMQLRKAADHPMLFRELYTEAKIKQMAKVITREIEFCDSRIDYIEEDMSVMTDFELHRLCRQYKSVNKFALPDDPWMHAGKVKELEQLLPKLINEDQSRILIFSQFTMVLDILESILKTMDFKYLRLDGQTKVEERQSLIDSFNDDESHKIFLLSTKAGGFGINLTGANVVIMYDLDFNPHNDKQAEDRAHRVGQTREVQVIKLISRGTIEEQIYQLANLKLKLDHHVSQDDSVTSTKADASGSSTPSAGIMSLIKQNWKATMGVSTTTAASSNGAADEAHSAV